jgi:hypothetical protein
VVPVTLRFTVSVALPPATFSATLTAVVMNSIVPPTSLSRMVSVVVDCPPMGPGPALVPVIVSATVSESSAIVSLTMVSGTRWLVTPGPKVSEPDVGA